MQTVKADIQKIETSASSLTEMSQDLNLDIARVAVTCAQANDGDLMAELCDTIPEGHPFKDCVRHMWFTFKDESGRLEKLAKRENAASIESLRSDLVSFLCDLDRMASEIDGEDASRQVIYLLMRYLPDNRAMGLLSNLEARQRKKLPNMEGIDALSDGAEMLDRMREIRDKSVLIDVVQVMVNQLHQDSILVFLLDLEIENEKYLSIKVPFDSQSGNSDLCERLKALVLKCKML